MAKEDLPPLPGSILNEGEPSERSSTPLPTAYNFSEKSALYSRESYYPPAAKSTSHESEVDSTPTRRPSNSASAPAPYIPIRYPVEWSVKAADRLIFSKGMYLHKGDIIYIAGQKPSELTPIYFSTFIHLHKKTPLFPGQKIVIDKIYKVIKDIVINSAPPLRVEIPFPTTPEREVVTRDDENGLITLPPNYFEITSQDIVWEPYAAKIFHKLTNSKTEQTNQPQQVDSELKEHLTGEEDKSDDESSFESMGVYNDSSTRESITSADLEIDVAFAEDDYEDDFETTDADQNVAFTEDYYEEDFEPDSSDEENEETRPIPYIIGIINHFTNTNDFLRSTEMIPAHSVGESITPFQEFTTSITGESADN